LKADLRAKISKASGGTVETVALKDLPHEKIFDSSFNPNMKLASRIEKIVFAAHNQMRTNPKSFIPMLDNSIKNFDSPRSARLRRFGRPDLIT